MTEKRVIFESEEEAYNFVKVIFNANCSTFPSAMKTLREAGYIRKNPVEEYKDMIKEYKNSTWDEHYYILHEKVIKSFDEKLKIANNAIQYLENQIVELNKKVGEI